MKRGKRFFENDNMFIYVGTVIFFVLAIALGIIMYMMTRTSAKIENNSAQVSQDQQIENDTESVATEIGKTVEEQDETQKGTSSQENVKNEDDKASVTTTEPKQEVNTTVNDAKITPDESDESSISSVPVEEKVLEQKKEITFTMPAEGEIICEFAKDNLIYSETLKEWITHTAIDIKANKTSVIKSAADGVIKSIVNDPRYGLTVVIEHNEGYETVYSNLLTAEFVVEGEEVAQGQTIGTAGNTSSFENSMESHLHFELLKDGEYLDPSIYLK